MQRTHDDHEEKEYYVNPIPRIIPVEDQRIHTDEFPFCPETDCPCHEDATLIAPVAQHVQDGLLTPQEATDFTMGKTWGHR